MLARSSRALVSRPLAALHLRFFASAEDVALSSGTATTYEAETPLSSTSNTSSSNSSSSSSSASGADTIAETVLMQLPSGARTLDGLPLPTLILVKPRMRRQPVGLAEAITAVKSAASARFDETVELAVNLGIDPRRGDQMVRGATLLPHGTGKSVRLCVFAKDEAAAAALAAGAEVVGGEDLVSEIQASGGSGLAFDKCIATPDMMPKLGRIARILGPRGLMPNPKLGTVTTNVADAIAMMRRGRAEFRADKGGVVHVGLGKVSFPDQHLAANIGALCAALLSARPKGVKGSGASGYLLSASLSSTMGPGIPVTIASLVHAAQDSKRSGA